MSASVFKPIRPQNFELPRIRAAVLGRGLRGVEKVRRVLFEPVDHADTELFLQRELAQHRLNECNKWEFDFKQEAPFHPNNNQGRYTWKPVTPPRVDLAPKKRPFPQEEYDNSELYITLPEKIKIPVVDTDPAEKVADVCKRQSKITDFMQSRKRPADLAFVKKSSAPSASPSKRAAPASS